jgi:hypothetical protein
MFVPIVREARDDGVAAAVRVTVSAVNEPVALCA